MSNPRTARKPSARTARKPSVREKIRNPRVRNTMSKPLLPLLAWPPAYNYVSETCGSYGCRKCWKCISGKQKYVTPAERPQGKKADTVYITTAFFRFEKEARRYLALPDYNGAQRGMFLDVSSTNEGNNFQWTPTRPCASSPLGDLLGGAPEYALPVLNGSYWTQIPIKEVFHTAPQERIDVAQNESWLFSFEPVGV